jgi:hypothetical protein
MNPKIIIKFLFAFLFNSFLIIKSTQKEQNKNVKFWEREIMKGFMNKL